MIRTFVAVAALALAAPAFANAQAYFEDADGVTVYGHGPYTYSIPIDVAGKPPGLVRQEISDAANAACQAVWANEPIDEPSPNAMNACVDDAWRDALQQYELIAGSY